jgi:glutaredoxin
MKSKELSISKLKKNISTKMHPIVIYALPNCPYCKSALELLDTHKIKYNKMIVENEKKEEYKKICSMETFPMIFIQKREAPEKYIKIGGFSDLQKYIQLLLQLRSHDIHFDILHSLDDLL